MDDHDDGNKKTHGQYKTRRATCAKKFVVEGMVDPSAKNKGSQTQLTLAKGHTRMLVVVEDNDKDCIKDDVIEFAST